MLPATVPLRAYRGDTWSQTFRFKEGDNPIDLAAPVVVAAWARQGTGHAVLTVTVDPDNAGMVKLELPTGMDPGNWAYDVEVTDADGVVTTWVRGQLFIEQDVTNAA